MVSLFANHILSIFSGVLLGGSLLEWLSHLTKNELNPFTWTDCKLPYFCWYFFNQYLSIVLVMMSIEKCIVVYFPLKTKNICTVKTAKWACLVAAVLLAAFNSQFFFIIEKRSNYCYYSEWYVLIYNRIDSVLYSFGPFVIMGLTNTAIIYKFIKAKLAVKRGTESTNQALSKTAMRGTAVLITVSLTFIILTGPVSIFYVIVKTSTDPVVYVAFHIPKTLNHGINGLMYCIVGSRFRQEVIGFIGCGRKKMMSGNSTTETGSKNVTGVSTITN